MESKEGITMEPSSSKFVSPRLQRIAKLAREAPGMVFTTLNPALDLALLKEAHRRRRKDGATGVDGRTAAEYSEHLEENLRSWKGIQSTRAALRCVPWGLTMVAGGDHRGLGGGEAVPVGTPDSSQAD